MRPQSPFLAVVSPFVLVSLGFLQSGLQVAALAFVGEYWLQSTRSRAALAASVTNFGGL
jgi:hypothetical protein